MAIEPYAVGSPLGIGERACWRCGFLAATPLERCPDDGTPLVHACIGDSDDPLVGQIVGERYRVMHAMAQGGVAAVYLARTRTSQEVALKVLRPTLKNMPTVRRRFVDEARLLSRLRHPNIVRVLDFGQLPDGNLFMAMEHLPGDSLHTLLERRALSYGEILSILEGLCSALGYIHRAGIVHRDLKPSNVMLLDPMRPKLIDFGVAQGLQSALQAESEGEHAVGTPMYMAPEQLLGRPATPGMDIYALGILAFLMMADRLPFGEGRREQRRKLSAGGAQPLRSVPGLHNVPVVLETIVGSMLRRAPPARPGSMDQVARALAFARREMPAALLSHRPAANAPGPIASEPTRRPRYRWPGLWELLRARPIWIAAAATATLLGVWISILE